MARQVSLLVLLVAVAAASCAGFQKGPHPLQDQLDSLRLAQMGTESRLAGLETRLSELERARRLEAARAAAQAAPVPDSIKAGAPEPDAPAAEPASAQPAPPEPGSPEALYEDGLRLLREERKPPEARALFERFLQENPQHALAPNALYWSAECLYDQKDFAGAVLAFKEVAASHPEHPKAAAALLKMGYSYLALDDAVNARDYLGRVERLYPESEAAAMARAALNRLDDKLDDRLGDRPDNRPDDQLGNKLSDKLGDKLGDKLDGRLAGPPAEAGKEEEEKP